MDDAMKALLAFGWQQPLTTFFLICQNGVCRHGWIVTTTTLPTRQCDECGSAALIVERIDPNAVVNAYMSALQEEAEVVPDEPQRDYDG